MIVLAAAMMMAAPAAPQVPGAERHAYATCLTNFVHAKLNDKMDGAKFKDAAHAACSTQADAFRAAWVNYDVAMRTKRSEAEENAASQIEDYLQNATDTYTDTVSPAPAHAQAAAASPGKPAAPASAVTQASSTTPPKP
ncbi:MAG TPA: hypothetical protein VFW19_04120 [Allosphingosinicella sp.]|nr:hypothetical protein [Allosphingosinicella sp.]